DIADGEVPQPGGILHPDDREPVVVGPHDELGVRAREEPRLEPAGEDVPRARRGRPRHDRQVLGAGDDGDRTACRRVPGGGAGDVEDGRPLATSTIPSSARATVPGQMFAVPTKRATYSFGGAS